MLHITTPYGKHYIVNDEGMITQEGRSFSGQWRMVGLAYTGPGFRAGKRFMDFEELTPEVIKNLNYRYPTSGNPKYTIIDFDHGTLRLWGNTQYHGVHSMWIEEN
jgi:hypothetical protein